MHILSCCVFVVTAIAIVTGLEVDGKFYALQSAQQGISWSSFDPKTGMSCKRVNLANLINMLGNANTIATFPGISVYTSDAFTYDPKHCIVYFGASHNVRAYTREHEYLHPLTTSHSSLFLADSHAPQFSSPAFLIGITVNSGKVVQNTSLSAQVGGLQYNVLTGELFGVVQQYAPNAGVSAGKLDLKTGVFTQLQVGL